MRFDQPGTTYTNRDVLNEEAVLDGVGVRLVNAANGRLAEGVRFARAGGTLVNEAGGTIRSSATSDPGYSWYPSTVVAGSDGADTVDNAGVILGVVQLGGGNDSFVDRGGSVQGAGRGVFLEDGDDSFTVTVSSWEQSQADGGAGIDTVVIAADDTGYAVQGGGFYAFERLVLQNGGNFQRFSGYQSIALASTQDYARYSLLDSLNPSVNLSLAGQSLSLAGSTLASVTGSGNGETVELFSSSGFPSASRILGDVRLGAGDDRFAVDAFYGGPVAPFAGAVDGGTGTDAFDLTVGSGETLSLDMARVTGFEALNVNASYTYLDGTVSLANLGGFSSILVGELTRLTLASGTLTGAELRGAAGGAITLGTGVAIGSYNAARYDPAAGTTASTQGDPTLSVAFVNKGSVGADVTFDAGNDSYDGRAGSVGGTVFGNAGDDVLLGGAGGDRLNGGAGADRLEGGGGRDVLTGGEGLDTFRGTLAELAGDTITDLVAGERIVVTDATAGSFTLARSGDVLTLNGSATLTVTGATRLDLVVRQAADGGVEIAARGNAVAGDVTGDGLGDLLWRNKASGVITEWAGTGQGFTPNISGSDAAPASARLAATFDWNGDGIDDLLFRSGGTFSIWTGRQGGGFTADAYRDTGVSADWRVIGTGDFNGDGRGDLLWRNADGGFTEWLGRDGGFVPNAYQDASVGNGWTLAGTFDWNGDGRDDLVWRQQAAGHFSIWTGKAGGGFDANAVYGAGVASNWSVAGLGDLNGDGREDLIWRSSNGTFTTWQSADGGFRQNVYGNTTVSGAWQIAQVADMNGDGRDDLVFRNEAAGQLTVWQSTGDAFVPNTAWVGGVSGDWQLVGASGLPLV